VIYLKKILIVEDNLLSRLGLVKIIKSIESELEILETGYAEEALLLSNNNKIDAFFLDIQLLDYSGIKLAKQIRDKDSYMFTPIVFVTAVPSRELEAFKTIHCYDYIIKPFSEDDVRDILYKILKHGIKSTEKRTIKLVQKSFTHVINQDEIIYIEVKYKKIYIITENEVLIYTSYTMNQIMDMLSSDFIKCHRSYVVNKNHIKAVNRSTYLIELRGTTDLIPYGRKHQGVLRGEWL